MGSCFHAEGYGSHGSLAISIWSVRNTIVIILTHWALAILNSRVNAYFRFPEAQTLYTPSRSPEATRRQAACRLPPGTAKTRRSRRAEYIPVRSLHTPRVRPAIRWAALC